MIKDKNKKTRSTKKYRYTAEEVADLCGVSVSYVKKLRAGLVGGRTTKARIVLEVDSILYDGNTALLKEVERIMKP